MVNDINHVAAIISTKRKPDLSKSKTAGMAQAVKPKTESDVITDLTDAIKLNGISIA